MSQDSHDDDTTQETPLTPQERDELIDGIVGKALEQSRHYLEQFARMATLARGAAQPGASDSDHATVLASLESIASEAQKHAKTDVDLYEGMRDGQTLKQQLQIMRDDEEAARADAAADAALFYMPSNETRH